MQRGVRKRGNMPKRLTPIERAIAGEPTDRRRRYDQRMKAKGFVRATFTVPADDVDILNRLSALSRTMDPDEFKQLLADAIQLLELGTERPQPSEDAPRHPRRPEARP